MAVHIQAQLIRQVAQSRTKFLIPMDRLLQTTL
jgi:hypothetical protein